MAETGERLLDPFLSARGNHGEESQTEVEGRSHLLVGAPRTNVLEYMEHPRHVPGSLMEDRSGPLGEDPRQVGCDPATGHVGETVDPAGRPASSTAGE